MRITKIVIGLDVTVNLGNYENLKPTASFEAELDHNEDVGAAAFQLRQRAQHELATQLGDLLIERANGGMKDCKDFDTVKSRMEASPLFKWVVQLDPDEADEVVAAAKVHWQAIHNEPRYEPLEFDDGAAPDIFMPIGSGPDDLDIMLKGSDAEVEALLDRYEADMNEFPPADDDTMLEMTDDEVRDALDDLLDEDADDEDEDDDGYVLETDDPDNDGGSPAAELPDDDDAVAEPAGEPV